MENINKIVPKPGLKLLKIGSRYMLVESSDSCVNLTNVYSLNETAAWLWDRVCEGEDAPGKLAEGLCQVYMVEYERALRDVERQLDEWGKMGLL